MNYDWNVCLELEGHEVPDDVINTLHDELADLNPAIGTAENGNLSIRVSVRGYDAFAALSIARARILSMNDEWGFSTWTPNIVGFEVITEAELDRKMDETS